jgi:hypothetical protein
LSETPLIDLFREWDAYRAAKKLPPRLWKSGCRPGRQSRRAANRAMRAYRPVPRARHAQKVVLTKLVIRLELRAKALKSLP